jgi:DNA mismatch repair protein MutS
MALIQEYFQLTKQYQDEYGQNTILLMQVGSFYECYALINRQTHTITGSRISDFTRICELNIAEKNVCVGKENVIMAGFKDSFIEKYIRKIQEAGFTAVVYKQDEQAKNTTRSLLGIFSPGTYFNVEENTKLTNNITCIWLQRTEHTLTKKGTYIHVGLANMDIVTGKSTLYEFQELYLHNPTTYDELERFVSVYCPSEVILVSNLSEKEIDDIVYFTNIQQHCSCIHKVLRGENIDKANKQSVRADNCEKQTYQKEILRTFYETTVDFVTQDFYEHVYATQSFCFLLDFLYQHNPYLVKKIAEPTFENHCHRVLLANHSLKQLNILDNHQYQGKFSSVSKMINVCVTPMGKRKLDMLLLNPTTDVELLQREYNMTDYIVENFAKFDDVLRPSLSSVKDLSKWNRQILLKKINPSCFIAWVQNLREVETLFDYLQKDTTYWTYLSECITSVTSVKEQSQEIRRVVETTLDLKGGSEGHWEENFILQGVDADLDKVTSKWTDAYDRVNAIREYFQQSLSKIEKKTSDYVKFHETEKNHFSLLATKRRCALLKTSLPKGENDTIEITYFSTYDQKETTFSFVCNQQNVTFATQSASNCCISNPTLDELCRSIGTLKLQIKDHVQRVYSRFLDTLETYWRQVENIVQFITWVDISLAKATVATKYHYCKPVLEPTQRSFVKVTGLRHALIEHLQQDEIYVANDMELGVEDQLGVLLYGTNAVGKTSFIRALGVAVILAQAGFFVPASSFVYAPYEAIFTRILGNDNLFKGLSSFAVEMSELRTILRLSNANSLILGDELCSGTESISAISIFVAGIEQLYTKECSFLFATHLHEIVHYEEITRLEKCKIKHMSVFYDREKNTLVYDRKLKEGAGDSMYGLEVCKSLHLPQTFLERANEVRMKYFPEAQSMLTWKTSHFNSKKVVGMCERCGKERGKEVHHLQYQREADETGYIQGKKKGAKFHKNHASNLMTLCETCHDEMHRENKQHARVKTFEGYNLVET